MTAALERIIGAELAKPAFSAAQAFADHLAAIYGPSTAAVLFYGSCLRLSSDEGLMLDYYVVVDDLYVAVGNVVSATFGNLLPPNVYYHELGHEGRILRAKVAVIERRRFVNGLGPSAFSSSLWARFAQPAALLFARDEHIRLEMTRAVASAVTRMIATTRPLMVTGFTAEELWTRALRETYGAELRPETLGKASALVNAGPARYRAITYAVLGEPNGAGLFQPNVADADQAARVWRWRRIAGKTLNVLRLIKAAFTFRGGLDYAAWKIERHSGVKIELTDAERRRPLITGLRLFWRTVKSGGLR